MSVCRLSNPLLGYAAVCSWEALLAHLVHHALPLHAVLACKQHHSRKQAAQSPTAPKHVERSVHRQGCSISAWHLLHTPMLGCHS